MDCINRNTVYFDIRNVTDFANFSTRISKLELSGFYVRLKICCNLEQAVYYALEVHRLDLLSGWAKGSPENFRKHVVCGEILESLLMRERISSISVNFDNEKFFREGIYDQQSNLPEFVYAIKSISTNFVKIGYSKDPQKRLADLSTASPTPLELIAIIPGSMSDEKALHNRFADYRANGEWFSLDGPVLQWVLSLRTPA